MKKYILFNLVILFVFANQSPAQKMNSIAEGQTVAAVSVPEDEAISDQAALSKLNAQFNKNFINMDTVAHNQIIDRDFVLIDWNGAIVNRGDYMREWATYYKDANYRSFDYTDETIRIFGNMAMIRAKIVYTREVDGKLIDGNFVYTDTYLKENGRWWCVQTQITPLPK
jgi:Domain of unknown function (DUF4440)